MNCGNRKIQNINIFVPYAGHMKRTVYSIYLYITSTKESSTNSGFKICSASLPSGRGMYKQWIIQTTVKMGEFWSSSFFWVNHSERCAIF